mmetsp:Transcript_20326/g.44234  ORF Transcript_20326/g.44234 Transcript_20326/m.44234 type:complete len:648 (+) Transcript_20326:225-2168(+)
MLEGVSSSTSTSTTRKRSRRRKTADGERRRRAIANVNVNANANMLLMKIPGILLPLLLLALWSSSIGINENGIIQNNNPNGNDNGSIPTTTTTLVVGAFYLSSLPSSLSSLKLREKNFGRRTGTITKPRSFLSSTSSATAAASESSATTPSNNNDGSSIEVWDGIFSPEVCEYLHELGIDHSERTTSEEDDYYDEEEEDDDSLDGSSIFVHRRRNVNALEEERLTPLEQALDSFLRAYYESHNSDAAPQNDIVVEYWCRQEHLNLEAHADVDEVFFERCCNKMDECNNKESASLSSSSSFGSGFRYPTVGHVLYLTRPTLGRGPTCVFPPNKQGQEKVGSISNNSNNTSNFITDEISSVVTIPAVPGRVLRFPGNALHAVPKPADVWFSNTNDSDGEDEEEEWDDDDDDDEERSVVLFNTWEATNDDDSGDVDDDVENNNDDKDTVGSSAAITGPIGVRRDPMFHVESEAELVDMMMSSADISIADSGLEVDEDFVGGMIRYAKQQKADLLNDWREKFSNTNDLEDGSTRSSTRSSEEEEHQDKSSSSSSSSPPVVYSKVHCQPRASWKLAQIDTDATSKNKEETGTDDNLAVVAALSIRVPLMGDKLRRRYPKKVVRWTVPPSFQEGVNDPERPFWFPLALIQSQK